MAGEFMEALLLLSVSLGMACWACAGAARLVARANAVKPQPTFIFMRKQPRSDLVPDSMCYYTLSTALQSAFGVSCPFAMTRMGP